MWRSRITAQYWRSSGFVRIDAGQIGSKWRKSRHFPSDGGFAGDQMTNQNWPGSLIIY
jgi:hypothetical protein